ncbi:aminodeoxychorismate synthase component I [Proteobacteria bacterium 005FR1]|nr:aminodeoxychorismate synthase component I [Proteobacteria bacterium 005FR1]
MASLTLHDLPYLADSSRYFQAVRDLPQPVWLDSGRPSAQFGRYDIISANPSHSLLTSGEAGKGADRDPFQLVESELARLHIEAPAELPFCGGAIGYFGYNLRCHLETTLEETPRDVGLPDMAVGLYEWAIVQDHLRQSATLVALPSCPRSQLEDIKHRAFNAVGDRPKSIDFQQLFSFYFKGLKSNFDLETYRSCIARIQAYIQAGDCYQVNFAQRFSSSFEGDPFAAFCHLRQLLPAPFSAYLELPQGAVLSHSPERFLKLTDRHVETRPIKGTAPRSADPEQDRRNAEWLSGSTKNRAENLMIVDLLRNDLGKTCRFGSVKTPKLFELESYANVHHLVSTVTGELRDDASPMDLLKGCFPGGSITGAPKVRAMEIIAELEKTDRSVYCGSIGYVSAHGNMDTNIAIRTLVYDGEQMFCWGGGGIVADSDPDAEYAESLAKIQILLDGLAGSR